MCASVFSTSRKYAMHTKRNSTRPDRLKRRINKCIRPVVADLDYFNYVTLPCHPKRSSCRNSHFNSNINRLNLDAIENCCSFKPRSVGGLTTDHTLQKLRLMPLAATSSHHPQSTHDGQIASFSPLSIYSSKTATTSITGSVPYPSYCPTMIDLETTLDSHFQPRYTSGGAVRTMGAGGRSNSCGGGGHDGDSPEPSGVHPGKGENDESNSGDREDESEGGKPKPSSYTFRRRNAIVEGSEDAPRVDDFPDDPK